MPAETEPRGRIVRQTNLFGLATKAIVLSILMLAPLAFTNSVDIREELLARRDELTVPAKEAVPVIETTVPELKIAQPRRQTDDRIAMNGGGRKSAEWSEQPLITDRPNWLSDSADNRRDSAAMSGASPFADNRLDTIEHKVDRLLLMHEDLQRTAMRLEENDLAERASLGRSTSLPPDPSVHHYPEWDNDARFTLGAQETNDRAARPHGRLSLQIEDENLPEVLRALNLPDKQRLVHRKPTSSGDLDDTQPESAATSSIEIY